MHATQERLWKLQAELYKKYHIDEMQKRELEFRCLDRWRDRPSRRRLTSAGLPRAWRAPTMSQTSEMARFGIRGGISPPSSAPDDAALLQPKSLSGLNGGGGALEQERRRTAKVRSENAELQQRLKAGAAESAELKAENERLARHLQSADARAARSEAAQVELQTRLLDAQRGVDEAKAAAESWHAQLTSLQGEVLKARTLTQASNATALATAAAAAEAAAASAAQAAQAAHAAPQRARLKGAAEDAEEEEPAAGGGAAAAASELRTAVRFAEADFVAEAADDRAWDEDGPSESSSNEDDGPDPADVAKYAVDVRAAGCLTVPCARCIF